MLEFRQTTLADLKNIQRLWADGDVMRYVGFPQGLQEPDEALQAWIGSIAARRPQTDHYSIYEDGVYCGETCYSIDRESRSASLDIKLFSFARGRGIAAKALSHAVSEAFRNGAETVWVDPHPENAKAIALYERLGFRQKEMPAHVIAMGEEPETTLYLELRKAAK